MEHAVWHHMREKMYSTVPDHDIEDSNCSTEGLLDGAAIARQRSTSKTLQMASLVVLIALCFGMGVFLGQGYTINLDQTCARHTTKYSPILDEVDIKYSEWQFNGSFTQENIYRHDASDEVDKAWNDLGINNRVLIISEEEGRKSGLSPKDHVQVNKKYGGGYPVMTEGLHQLHCLNLLRKSLWYNFEHYNATHQAEFALSNAGQPFRWHVSHCLDFLRQRLMCDVDTGVFGAVWYGNKSEPLPFVDFNTKHTCKNFDDVREWATKRQSAEDLPDDYWEIPDPQRVNIRPAIP